jgi:adenylate kinase family enzyme
MKNSKQQFVIMMVGKTHSGKTTFGKKIAKKIPDSLVLDADIFAVFLREQLPIVHLRKDLIKPQGFKDPSLQYLLFKTALVFALGHGFNPILTNSNRHKAMRDQIRKIVKKSKAKLIIVDFDLPTDLLLKRIDQAKKSTSVLTYSKNFKEVLLKTQSVHDFPTEPEADFLFRVKQASDLKAIEGNIIRLISA